MVNARMCLWISHFIVQNVKMSGAVESTQDSEVQNVHPTRDLIVAVRFGGKSLNLLCFVLV